MKFVMVVSTLLLSAVWVPSIAWADTDAAALCDANYSGSCVPVAFDVDCAGGKGNGPAYVSGPVVVTGEDIYGLDRDHDGIGCEPSRYKS